MFITIPSFTADDLDPMQHLLNWWDIVLVPFYFYLIIKLGKWYYHNKSTEKNNEKLFLSGLKVKMIGGMLISLIYALYYKGGDTTYYFNDGRLLSKLFLTSPGSALQLLLSSGYRQNWSDSIAGIVGFFTMATRPSNWFVVKIAAVFSIFSFGSMLCISLWFAFLAYICLWKFYCILIQMYPHVKSKLSIVILYAPCVIMWGSGIFKDTITISAMLLLFCSIYELFFKRKKITKNLMIVFICSYVIYTVKSYILMSFLLSVVIWLMISLVKYFKTGIARILFIIFVVLSSMLLSLISINFINTELKTLAIEDILEKTAQTGEAIQRDSDRKDGSTYDIGKIDPSIKGFLLIAPKAINVALFRPYLWEARKIFFFFSAVESTVIFLFFVYVVMKNRIIFFFTKILRDPYLMLCIVFTCVFSTFIGISSGNFGTLVRYKIPCIPFFLSALVIMAYKQDKQKSDSSTIFETTDEAPLGLS